MTGSTRTRTSGTLEHVDRAMERGDDFLVLARIHVKGVGDYESSAGAYELRVTNVEEAYEVDPDAALPDDVTSAGALFRYLKRQRQAAVDLLAGKSVLPGLDPEHHGGDSWLVTFDCGHVVQLPEAFWAKDLDEPEAGWLEEPVPLGDGAHGRCPECPPDDRERVVSEFAKAPPKPATEDDAPDDAAELAWLELAERVADLVAARQNAANDATRGEAQSELDALFALLNGLAEGEHVEDDGIFDAEGYLLRDVVALPDVTEVLERRASGEVTAEELTQATGRAVRDTPDVGNVLAFPNANVLPWEGYDTSTVEGITNHLKTAVASLEPGAAASLLEHVRAFETAHRARKSLLGKLDGLAPEPAIPPAPDVETNPADLHEPNDDDLEVE